MKENRNSEARIRTNNKWTNAHYDRINIAVPKGWKELIQTAADTKGYPSVNAYVKQALKIQLARDGIEIPEQPVE